MGYVEILERWIPSKIYAKSYRLHDDSFNLRAELAKYLYSSRSVDLEWQNKMSFDEFLYNE